MGRYLGGGGGLQPLRTEGELDVLRLRVHAQHAAAHHGAIRQSRRCVKEKHEFVTSQEGPEGLTVGDPRGCRRVSFRQGYVAVRCVFVYLRAACPSSPPGPGAR